MPLIYLSEDSIAAASAALLLVTKKDDFMGGPTLGELVNIERAFNELNRAGAHAGVLTNEVREAIEEALSSWIVSTVVEVYNGYAKSADVDLVQQRSDKALAWLGTLRARDALGSGDA